MSALGDVPARTAGALGLVLAYGAGAWLVVLHHAQGGHERAEPPLLLHVAGMVVRGQSIRKNLRR